MFFISQLFGAADIMGNGVNGNDKVLVRRKCMVAKL